MRKAIPLLAGLAALALPATALASGYQLPYYTPTVAKHVWAGHNPVCSWGPGHYSLNCKITYSGLRTNDKITRPTKCSMRQVLTWQGIVLYKTTTGSVFC